jgi:hypothetical protein
MYLIEFGKKLLSLAGFEHQLDLPFEHKPSTALGCDVLGSLMVQASISTNSN